MSNHKLNSKTFTANSVYITHYKGRKQCVSTTTATTVPPCNKHRYKSNIQQSTSSVETKEM